MNLLTNYKCPKLNEEISLLQCRYDKFYLKNFIINITCLNLLVVNVPILEKFSFNTIDFELYSPKERMCICEEIELSFKTSSKY